MKYHIAAVARMTNLSTDLIRSWERRYKLVEPARDDAGLRVYSDSDVARLTLARMATNLGHPIRRVAAMSNEELEALATSNEREAETPYRAVVDRLLAALHQHDAEGAEQILASAALLLPPRALALEVIAPVLRETGSQWEAGRISVWQEHLLSSLVRATALAVPRLRRNGPVMLLATPPFDLHEFGIALAAMLAASHGARTYNLGPTVPVDELADAARRLHARVVVVGMTRRAIPAASAVEYAAALDERLPPDVEIWLGGTLGADAASAVASSRVRAVPTLEEFERMLASAR